MCYFLKDNHIIPNSLAAQRSAAAADGVFYFPVFDWFIKNAVKDCQMIHASLETGARKAPQTTVTDKTCINKTYTLCRYSIFARMMYKVSSSSIGNRSFLSDFNFFISGMRLICFCVSFACANPLFKLIL